MAVGLEVCFDSCAAVAPSERCFIVGRTGRIFASIEPIHREHLSVRREKKREIGTTLPKLTLDRSFVLTIYCLTHDRWWSRREIYAAKAGDEILPFINIMIRLWARNGEGNGRRRIVKAWRNNFRNETRDDKSPPRRAKRRPIARKRSPEHLLFRRRARSMSIKLRTSGWKRHFQNCCRHDFRLRNSHARRCSRCLPLFPRGVSSFRAIVKRCWRIVRCTFSRYDVRRDKKFSMLDINHL